VRLCVYYYGIAERRYNIADFLSTKRAWRSPLPLLLLYTYNRVKDDRLITFNQLFDYTGQILYMKRSDRDSRTKSEHCS